jgi:RNA polymerase sigma-70 factor, ECF subfamily
MSPQPYFFRVVINPPVSKKIVPTVSAAGMNNITKILNGTDRQLGTFVERSASQGCGAGVSDDFGLIDRTLAGDREAFGDLVKLHQDRLYTSMFHVTGSRQEAEDVVQDAFVQAFVKLPTFQRSSAFYTWLYRIAFNLAASRRRRRRPEVSVDEAREFGVTEPVARQAEASEEVEREEGVEQVRSAIQRLSEEHRAILILREMDGCCYETIAEILNVRVGTVRSRLHRARAQLREILWKEFAEEGEAGLATDDG